MDHKDAERINASTRYLMGDLPAEESAAFEDHYFTCAECAAEVVADEAFAANLRTVFNDQAVLRPFESRVTAPHVRAAWRPRFAAAFAMPLAAAACLALGILVYQNLLVIPGLRTQVAELRDPPAPIAVALKLSREENRFSIPQNSPFWVPYFRLTKPDAWPAYDCEIQTASGAPVKSLSSLTARRGQPFYLLLQSSLFPDGAYKFKIRGHSSKDVIAEYTIDVVHE